MSGKDSQVGQELGKFVRAFWLELPLAAANQILGDGDEQALNKAGWKAYDAFVSLTNEAINQLYQDRTIGTVTARATETALRAQHISAALSSAFFGNLWPAIGLPTANEIAALRSEIAALHSDLTEAVDAVEGNDASSTTRPFTLTDDGVRIFDNGHLVRVKEEDDDDAAA